MTYNGRACRQKRIYALMEILDFLHLPNAYMGVYIYALMGILAFSHVSHGSLVRLLGITTGNFCRLRIK